MINTDSHLGYTPMAWDAPSNGRSPDWVFSESSTTHLTNDKSWFEGDLVAFDSQISNAKASIANIPVKGVGTVVLPVKQSIAGQGTGYDASLRLENVLYVPDYPCNVIGSPIKAVASIQFSSLTPRGAMVYGDGSIAAIFMPGRDFYQVLLRETPGAPMLGRSVLDSHPEYGFMLGFTWLEQEQQRWRNYESSLRAPPRIASSCANEFRFSMAQTMNFEQGWPSMEVSMEVDTQKSKKRGAPDEEMDCSPRRVKRSRAMDGSEFGSPRPMRAIFSASG